MRTVRAAVDRGLEAVLAVLFATMTSTVVWQVAARYLIGRPSPWTDELARFLLIWLGLLGASYASGRRLHLAIELWERSVVWRRWSRRISLLATLAFGALVLGAGGGFLVALQSDLGQRSAALGLPLGCVYAVLPISGALVAFYAIAELIGGAKPEETP
jgi:TRAP-type C4-dicarboxylate transport system permease small subunit